MYCHNILYANQFGFQSKHSTLKGFCSCGLSQSKQGF